MAFWNRTAEKAEARRRSDEAVAELRTLRRKLADDLQKELPATKAGLLPEFPANDPWVSKGGDMNRAAKPTVKVELPSVVPGPWGDPQKVINALAAHDLGNFRVSGLLMNALTTDPCIRGPLDVRCKALTGLNINFKPANDTEQAKQCCDYVTAHFREWLPAEEQERFTRTRLLMGASLAQKIWTDVGAGPDKMTVPAVNCWEPQYLYWWWDGPNRNFGHWQVIHSANVEEPIEGGKEWIWAKNTAKDPQYTGLIRSLGLRYVARLQALQGLGIYQQRYALAILKLKQPADFDEADVATIQAQLLSNKSPLVTLPQGVEGKDGWDVEWENIDSTSGWQVFITTLDVLKAEFAIDILGQTLTSDTGASGGGAHALGKVHDGVRMDLRVSDAKYDATIWRDQLLKPFAAINYGDPELAPIMEYETETSPSLEQQSKSLQELGTFFNQASQAKVDLSPLDMAALFSQYGLPLKSDLPQEG